MEVALARGLGIGLALGVLTGIPLGVVNIAVIEIATRDRRRATWLGIGGALADATHTALAIIGYGALITRSALATRVLAVTSAAIVAGYAVWVVRGRGHGDGTAPAHPTPTGAVRAIGTGLALTLPNPGALMAWTAVAAAVFPAAPPAVAIATAIGVGLGSAVWFAMLARIAARTRLADHRWASRAVAGVLLVLAAVAIVHAIRI